MSLLINHFYRFDDFTLDSGERVLLRQGKPLTLTPKAFDTLLILVENGGRIVSKEEFMQRLWPDSFVEETNLTFNIRQLRRLLGDDAHQPRYIETVPRRGYRFIAVVEEVLSESAPAGNRLIQRVETADTIAAFIGDDFRSDTDSSKTHDTEAACNAESQTSEVPELKRAELPAQRSFRKTSLALAAVIVLIGCGWLLRSRLSYPSQPPVKRATLAVLPFQNLTGDASQDYVSDGLTEEMITQLGNVDPRQLGVIARTSVMHYKNSQESLDQIARTLGVEYVLEGSVRRDADNVRVTVQLIQTQDQTSVWAQQYDRQVQNLLALEREIGREVAGHIQAALGSHKPEEPSQQVAISTLSYEAYDLWLKGQYFLNKRRHDGLQKAIEYYHRAVDKDPNYARAYVGLADCYALIGGYSQRPQAEYLQRSRAAALRALEIDENLPEAHTALALILELYDWDWQKAEQEFLRAIELNPNYATAHHWYAEHLAWRGRFDEALRESEQARKLDPLSLIIAADNGVILYYARQYDRAIQQFRAVRELDFNFPRSGIIVHAYGQKGLFAEAIADIEAHHPPPGTDQPWYWSELAYIYGRSGQTALAQQALASLLAGNRRQELDAVTIAIAYVWMENKDQALTWLEKAYSQHSNSLVELKVDPRYDPLRTDPRFQDLLRRVGLDQ
jgi:TolB-like protein/DNA-binding winged helix-turn-helix (wHTH) protein/Tfp pilus assembly protein PilF